MKLYSEGSNYKLYQGNMLDMLDVIEPNSIDSIVTDPPYELNFMNKGWDSSGVAFQPETWNKCLQVLKPGGYLLAFGGSRTYHRIACAIEDAGFEIRDTIMWLYGSGFPKSMSVSKGIDAREKYGNAGTRNKRKVEQSCDTEEYTLKQTNNGAMGELIETTRKEYIPSTDLAKQWDGWGTCLKPSYEPIIVARKPFAGSLVDNVIRWGVGGINIDECRVGEEERTQLSGRGQVKSTVYNSFNQDNAHYETVYGRFPANTILGYDSECEDEVCGGMPDTVSSGGSGDKSIHSGLNGDVYMGGWSHTQAGSHLGGLGDSGSASRYFKNLYYTDKDIDEEDV